MMPFALTAPPPARTAGQVAPPLRAISPDGPHQPLPGPRTPDPSEPPKRDPEPDPPQRDPQREPPRIDPPTRPPEPGNPPPQIDDPPLPDQPPNIIGTRGSAPRDRRLSGSASS